MNDRRHEAGAQRVDGGGAKRCARQRPLDSALSATTAHRKFVAFPDFSRGKGIKYYI
jgi:hypothetical protein